MTSEPEVAGVLVSAVGGEVLPLLPRTKKIVV
jgi:hypothetical protein